MPLFITSFVGTPFTQRHEILPQNTRDSNLSYGANVQSLSHLVLERYQDVTYTNTDRQTDRITVANTR